MWKIIFLIILNTFANAHDYIHKPVQYDARSESGSYKYGYDTGLAGSHQFHQENKDSTGLVRGKYGYTAPDGKLVLVHYTAGEDGFKVKINGDEDKDDKVTAKDNSEITKDKYQYPIPKGSWLVADEESTFRENKPKSPARSIQQKTQSAYTHQNIQEKTSVKGSYVQQQQQEEKSSVKGYTQQQQQHEEKSSVKESYTQQQQHEEKSVKGSYVQQQQKQEDKSSVKGSYVQQQQQQQQQEETKSSPPKPAKIQYPVKGAFKAPEYPIKSYQVIEHNVKQVKPAKYVAKSVIYHEQNFKSAPVQQYEQKTSENYFQQKQEVQQSTKGSYVQQNEISKKSPPKSSYYQQKQEYTQRPRRTGRFHTNYSFESPATRYRYSVTHPTGNYVVDAGSYSSASYDNAAYTDGRINNVFGSESSRSIPRCVCY